MNSMKRITLTGYTVQYVDLRAPKPRPVTTEIFPLDEEIKTALNLLGRDVTGYIREKYENHGFHCIEVSKIPGKQIRYVDYRMLWEASGGENTPEETGTDQVTEC